MKEIIEALSSRIRSPLFGYFMLSFAVINWEVIYYLFASHKSADARIAYFHDNSDISIFLYLPLLFAVIGAVAYPYINYFFLKISKYPTDLKNLLQAQSEHALLIQKQELEGARSSLLSTQESDLIERAKRDAELNKIEDEDVKLKLKNEIEQLRKERDNLQTNKDKKTKKHTVSTDLLKKTITTEKKNKIKTIMETASTYRDRSAATNIANDRNNLLSQAYALEGKAHALIMESEEPNQLLNMASLYRDRSHRTGSSKDRDRLLSLAQQLETRAHDLLVN